MNKRLTCLVISLILIFLDLLAVGHILKIEKEKRQIEFYCTYGCGYSPTYEVSDDYAEYIGINDDSSSDETNLSDNIDTSRSIEKELWDGTVTQLYWSNNESCYVGHAYIYAEDNNILDNILSVSYNGENISYDFMTKEINFDCTGYNVNENTYEFNFNNQLSVYKDDSVIRVYPLTDMLINGLTFGTELSISEFINFFGEPSECILKGTEDNIAYSYVYTSELYDINVNTSGDKINDITISIKGSN